MANVVVFGVTGETDLWIADLQAGTVKRLDAVTGDLAQAAGLRKSGGTVVKNVDFAVGVSSAKEVFAGHFDG
jgi:hypothetical protein